MGQLRDALGAACPEIEGRARSRLVVGPSEELHQWLPQSWAFKTPTESATLHLSVTGAASATDGVHEPVDLTVNWNLEDLIQVLTAKTRSVSFLGKNPVIRFHTANGQRSFSLLRGAIGL